MTVGPLLPVVDIFDDRAAELAWLFFLVPLFAIYYLALISTRLSIRTDELQLTLQDLSSSRRREDELRDYASLITRVQEEERKRLARELHDEIGQVLTAVKINLQSVLSSNQTSVSLPQIEESIVIIDDALGRIRELSLELRPALLDDLGLSSALRWYVDRYAQRTGIVVEVLNGFEVNRSLLTHEVETACFRIAQEALTNVARHAHAGRVSIQLERSSEELRLTIADNGIGFDAEEMLKSAAAVNALGLRGMKERALAVSGRIAIQSAANLGTQVRATFPLKRTG